VNVAAKEGVDTALHLKHGWLPAPLMKHSSNRHSQKVHISVASLDGLVALMSLITYFATSSVQRTR